MTYTDTNPHLQLTFNEVNILLVNLRRQNKAGLIDRLVNLSNNTTDPFLLQDIESLKLKIMELSESELEQVREAVSSGDVLFPANYVLPKFTV